MKHDYRKLLKVVRHVDNQKAHIPSIENMIEMFSEKWKEHSTHPLYVKAYNRIQLELESLKESLNYFKHE